jgi:hypothetical protein
MQMDLGITHPQLLLRVRSTVPLTTMGLPGGVGCSHWSTTKASERQAAMQSPEQLLTGCLLARLHHNSAGIWRGKPAGNTSIKRAQLQAWLHYQY